MAVRYQPLGPLLSGEGSRAFLALEISESDTARPVVLVWAPEEANRDQELLARIRRETEHAASLDHPNIIKVHGLAMLEEGAARVVEFADGESLRRVLDVVKKLPPQLAAKVAADAAMGVNYAHLAGNEDGTPLLHGDIRPETIIVSFAGVTKVSGYGALKVAPRELGGQRVMGRRAHCAPEQVVGGRDTFLPQTDVYLLGLTLYECLTGTIPFVDEPDFDTAVLAKPLPSIPGGEVPAALQEVVARACAKKAPERYATPLQFRQAVEDAMGGSLPANEELAAFLADHFPPSEQNRAARRHAIDAGIADFARRQWERKPAAPQPAPDAPAPAPAAPPPQNAPARKLEPAFVREEPGPRPSEQSSRRTLYIVGGIGVAAIGLLWVATRVDDEPKEPPPLEKALAKAHEPPKAAEPPKVTAPDDAGARAAEPPTTASAPEPALDAGRVALAKAEEPAPPPVLELYVEPAVDIIIDGKELGRASWSGPMEPGRYVVKLKDESRGINTSRVVVVKARGKTVERIYLKKGYINVSAPDGASIFIDGKKVGTAPVRGEIGVYEGTHKIMVTVGKAKWQQGFSVRPNERMYFNVEPQ